MAGGASRKKKKPSATATVTAPTDDTQVAHPVASQTLSVQLLKDNAIKIRTKRKDKIRVADFMSPPLDSSVAFRLSSNDHYVWINDEEDKAVVPPNSPTLNLSETLTNCMRHCFRNTSISYASTIPTSRRPYSSIYVAR